MIALRHRDEDETGQAGGLYPAVDPLLVRAAASLRLATDALIRERMRAACIHAGCLAFALGFGLATVLHVWLPRWLG